MQGLIGKKLGMTSIFDAAGRNIPCTVVEVGPCVVTQIKTEKSDGYTALQLGFKDKKVKNTPRAEKGHFDKSNTAPKRKVVEFRNFMPEEVKLGDEIRVEDVFVEGALVHVVGTSKGKGFQGVVKRHGFKGVNDRTHGQHNRQRAPGSIGAASYPARVFKGLRMAGRMGGDRVKMKNLKVVKVFPDKNLLLVGGAVPGHKGSFVIIEEA